ncbi:MFS transporter [Paenarthrobacter nicotinovorans]|uniref:MFS transporter n=1 Tax=Paenarthrobacter nicotinovorans TaxID=29320 RepID=UPI003806477F
MIALTLMGVVVFVAITYEVLPVGLLGSIGADLASNEQGAGLLVSTYSFVVVLGAIPLSALLAKQDARRTLLIVLAVFAFSAGLLGFASSLPMAMLARVVGGLAHALLFTAVYRIALAVVPSERKGLAAAAVSGGNAVALSLGVPAATALGGAMSWRTSFAVVSCLFGLLIVLSWVVIPSRTGGAGQGMRAGEVIAEMQRWPLLRMGITITVLMVAHFTAYTYVEPLLREAGIVDESVSVVLFGYGVASVVGLMLVSRISDRRPTAALRVVIALLVITMLGIWVAHAAAIATAAIVIVWGLTFGALPVLLHVLALRASDHAPEIAPPVVNTTFNVGITLGAVVGGQVLVAGNAAATTLVSFALFLGMLSVAFIPRWLPRDRTS